MSALLNKVQQLTIGDDWYNCDKNLLFETYQQVFLKPVNQGCSACLQDAFYELKVYAKQMSEGVMQLKGLKRYEIKKDPLIYIAGIGSVTAKNLSDDLIAFIEKNHPHIFSEHFCRKEKKQK